MSQETSAPADNYSQSGPVAARFEAAWRSATGPDCRPRIQDYLAGMAEPGRSAAFRTLLALELQYRQAHRENPTPEDYYRQFPDADALIESVFAECGSRDQQPTPPKAGGTPTPRGTTQNDSDSHVTVDYTPSAGPEPEPVPEMLDGKATGVRMVPSTGLHDTLVRGRPAEHSHLPTLDGYEILGELGKGGMGIVYKARHLRLQRLVALKMLLPRGPLAHGPAELEQFLHLSSRQRELDRFLTEARAVAQFQHPNLVQIYEIGEHAGQPYLSLELLEGGSLSKKLGGMPQPGREAAALLETLARAMDYAHQKGVVHRDLKPANVLLRRKPESRNSKWDGSANRPTSASDGSANRPPSASDGSAIRPTSADDGAVDSDSEFRIADFEFKISDFGLAKQLDQDSAQTEQGEILGTPSYMAPEQALGDSSQVGFPADIYALGAILYEVLTGRPPFKAASKWQTVELVRTQEPVPPRHLVPQVPRDLELICLKCLRKDPLQRFPTALALAEELRRFQDGRPIQTRPTPVWERAWRWTRRKPAIASLVAVSGVALLLLVLYLDNRARTARRELHAGGLREKVQLLHREAQTAAGRGRLQEAQDLLTEALGIIHAEPSLGALQEPLERLQTEMGTYRQFAADRDTALFRGMVLIGVDRQRNITETKEACQKALALFGVTIDSRQRPDFPEYLSAERRQEYTAACYELLLVWAEAVAQPDAGMARPATSHLAEALGLLDRASRLGIPVTQAYHLRRASYLRSLGDARAARHEAELAAATPPQGALDYFLTGDSHQKAVRLEPAAQAFANALRSQPDHFWARYYLAVCNLQQLDRAAQARDNFTACLAARPDFLWLYLYRGFANGQLNDFRAAEEDYRRAAALPDTQAHYGILVNQASLCTRQARAMHALPPGFGLLPLTPNLEFALRSAIEARRQERLAAAESLLKRAIASQPNQYPAYSHLAQLAQRQKRPDEAIARLGQALAAVEQQKRENALPGPEEAKRQHAIQAQLYGQRARVYHETRELPAALRDLDQALQLAPSAEDHAERGRIYHERRQYPSALADYEAALHLRPDLADVYRLKANALQRLHRDPEAMIALDQYLAKGGRPTAAVYQRRGRIRAQLKQFAGALADYNQAVTLEADSTTYTLRGWVFLANRVPDLAQPDFEQAIRLDVHNGEAYAGRGLIRVLHRQYAEAIADAEAARRGQPRTARLFWNVSHIYCELARHLAAQPGAYNPSPGLSRTDCEKRALELLRQALAVLKTHDERVAFWHDYVAGDALLNPLRGSAGFDGLERTYGTKSMRTVER